MRRLRHSIRGCLLAGLLCISPVLAAAEEATDKIVVSEDTYKFLTVQGQIKTIVFGDMDIAQGRAISATEILLIGVSKGETPLLVFLQDGQRQQYLVSVRSSRTYREDAYELRALLGETPGITIRLGADGILSLEGRPETQEDADRIKLLLSILPDVRNHITPFGPAPDDSRPASSPKAFDDSERCRALQDIQVGTRVLVPVEGKLKTVTIENPEIATGRSVSATEFVVLGVKDGQTTVVALLEDGTRKSYPVRVRMLDAEKTARELRVFLGEMEGVSVRVIARKVLVEGTPLTMDDKCRVLKAIELYPEVRDLTPTKAGLINCIPRSDGAKAAKPREKPSESPPPTKPLDQH